MPACRYCNVEHSDRQISRHLKTHRHALEDVLDAMDEDDLDISFDDGRVPYDIPAPIDDGPAPLDNNLAVEAEGPPPGHWGDIDLAAVLAKGKGRHW